MAPVRESISSFEAEYGRYKALGEGAFRQLDAAELTIAAGGNSVATLVWHIAGNLTSRFTDFLTTDGEKPWRDRESEFDERPVTQDELLKKWNGGWDVLFASLAALSDADLRRQVTIREQPLRVEEALHRSLAHTAYHVGQIVFIARSFRGEAWESLSIPRDVNRRSPSR
jgi:uncharacterized damage-inducible protein DinB